VAFRLPLCTTVDGSCLERVHPIQDEQLFEDRVRLETSRRVLRWRNRTKPVKAARAAAANKVAARAAAANKVAAKVVAAVRAVAVAAVAVATGNCPNLFVEKVSRSWGSPFLF
jgi:hypothetical protein